MGIGCKIYIRTLVNLFNFLIMAINLKLTEGRYSAYIREATVLCIVSSISNTQFLGSPVAVFIVQPVFGLLASWIRPLTLRGQLKA